MPADNVRHQWVYLAWVFEPILMFFWSVERSSSCRKSLVAQNYIIWFGLDVRLHCSERWHFSPKVLIHKKIGISPPRLFPLEIIRSWSDELFIGTQSVDSDDPGHSTSVGNRVQSALIGINVVFRVRLLAKQIKVKTWRLGCSDEVVLPPPGSVALTRGPAPPTELWSERVPDCSSYSSSEPR